MKRLLLFILILMIITSFSAFSFGETQERYIVTLSEPLNSHVIDILSAHNAKVLHKFNVINGFVIQANPYGLKGILKSLNIKSIEIDQEVSIEVKPVRPGKPPKDETPPDQTIEWGIDAINADEVWGSYSGTGVKIAIIDTGIDLSHQDLAVQGGANFVRSAKTYNDDNGHGTHVAGIVAALNNEIGVVGVAYNSNLYAVKVLNKRGVGYLSDVIRGIEWSIEKNMNIINMSLSSNSPSLALENILDAANANGIITVAAAGNDASEINYPAAYENTICVGAIDIDSNIAYFSSYGLQMDVAAPGVSVFSTYKSNTYKSLSGTSMSAPHIAGLAALYLQKNPLGDLYDFRDFLIDSSTDLGNPGHDVYYGYGLPDANALIE